jgi:hypothetical protein
MVAFKELGLISRAALLATLHTLLNGCNGAVCKEGTEDCPCTADDSCEAGLFCEERVCKVDDADRRKPPKTEDGEGAPGTGGSGASTGAEDDGSEEPDGSNTGGTGATAPGEDSAGGARDEEPDEDAGAAGPRAAARKTVAAVEAPAAAPTPATVAPTTRVRVAAEARTPAGRTQAARAEAWREAGGRRRSRSPFPSRAGAAPSKVVLSR